MFFAAVSVPAVLPVWEIIVRLLCAMAIGMIMGTEREYTRHPAGMRTHTLVALGACTVMITGQLIFQQYAPLGAAPDPARMAAQVIAGVGFLGAGTILRDGTTVKGLTTAAGIWVVACLGVAVGAGHYVLAIVGAALAVSMLISFEWLQKRFLHHKNPMWQVTLITTDISKASATLPEIEKIYRVHADSVQMDNLGDGTLKIIFRAQFTGKNWENNVQRFWQALNDQPEITVQRVKEWNGK